MDIKYTTQQIFWKPDSEDKPSLTYFNDFKNSFNEGDIKVNFLNFDNVEIVGKIDNITYVWINYNGKNYYYYTNSITKILNNGYTYNLFLDTFTSFTLPFLEQLKNLQLDIYSLRQLKQTDHSFLYLEDKLLNSIPKTYIGWSKLYSEYPQTQKDGLWYYPDSTGNLLKRDSVDLNGCVYAVFENVDLEFLYQTTTQSPTESEWNRLKQKVNWVALPYLTKDPFKTAEIIDYKYKSTRKLYLNAQNIGYLINNEWANYYIGDFILPNCLEYSNIGFVKVNYNPEGISPPTTIQPVYGILGLPKRLNFNKKLRIKTYSNDDNINKTILKYEKYRIYDNELNWSLFYEKDDFNLPIINLSGSFTFNMSGQLTLYNDLIDNRQNVVNYPNLVTCVSNTYQAYVNNTRNTINTSWEIAKENTVKNTITGLLGLGTGLATGIASGGIGLVAGIGMGLNSANSLTGSWLSLSQKRREIQAQYADAKNSLLPKINASINSDLYLQYVENINENTYTQAFVYDKYELSEKTINLIKWYINYYGYYNPKFYKCQDLLSLKNNNYNYILLDEEHTDKLINVYASCPVKYRESVLNDLTTGIRLWDEVPNYGLTV